MDISGVGGIGMSGLMASSALSGVAAVSGLTGPQASAGATAMSGVAFGRMDQLVQLLDQFSTAEILLALMLAQAKKPEDRPGAASGDVGNALSFALLAGSLPSQAPAPAVSMSEMAAPVTGLLGGQINIQA